VTPATLTHRIAQLPRRTRHIVASIVAWRMSPEEPQGMSQEWRDRANEWAGIWAMVTDHDASYPWPSEEEVGDALRECGVDENIIRAALVGYMIHGEPLVANTGAYRTGPDVRTWAEQLASAMAIDSKYQWSEMA
jgi:hypothetical protein